MGNYCIVILNRLHFHVAISPLLVATKQNLHIFTSGKLRRTQSNSTKMRNLKMMCIYRCCFVFFFVTDWVRCKDEFDNAENDVLETVKKIGSLYLWVNRSIGAIHVVVAAIAACAVLGWPKMQLVPIWSSFYELAQFICSKYALLRWCFGGGGGSVV